MQPDYGRAGPQASAVHLTIEAVCPIYGVSIGRWGDRSTWRIDFHPEATEEQRDAARTALAAFKLQDAHAEDMGAPIVIA